jgi:transposase
MNAKHLKAPAERVVKDIRRATRQYSAEEKIRIVLEGLLHLPCDGETLE